LRDWRVKGKGGVLVLMHASDTGHVRSSLVLMRGMHFNQSVLPARKRGLGHYCPPAFAHAVQYYAYASHAIM
jgi:hypothetical protein